MAEEKGKPGNGRGGKRRVRAGLYLVRTVDRATTDDLNDLNNEIQKREDDLHSLRAIRDAIAKKFERSGSTDHGDEEHDGPAHSPSILSLTDKYRRDAATLLLKGPLTQAKISEECGIPMGSIAKVLSHSWFQKTSGGFYITVEGRRAVA